MTRPNKIARPVIRPFGRAQSSELRQALGRCGNLVLAPARIGGGGLQSTVQLPRHCSASGAWEVNCYQDNFRAAGRLQC